MREKMFATVSGTTVDDIAFTERVEFTLIPPADPARSYGTGYYMRVAKPDGKHLVDVRYERTTDIEVLADRWIEGYYGQNAKDIVKEFPEE